MSSKRNPWETEVLCPQVQHIVTRGDVDQQAIQFEPTQESVDEVQTWINMFDANLKLTWTGEEEDEVFAAMPGMLVLTNIETGHEMEASPGDWLVKSSRDTFYTVPNDLFNELFVVMH